MNKTLIYIKILIIQISLNLSPLKLYFIDEYRNPAKFKALGNLKSLTA